MVTLKIYIQKNPLLDSERLLTIFEQMADFMFEQFGRMEDVPGFDPSNILVDEHGCVVDIDIENKTANPHYVAPEILQGKSPDFKSHIYNLGAAFYFIATRHDPYGTYLDQAPREEHWDRILIEPEKFNSKLAPEIGALIRKMLSVMISTRHRSIAAFKLDLNNVKRGDWPINAPVSLNVHGDEMESTGQSKARRQSPNPKKKHKQIAVSSERLADARRKQHSALRRSGNGFVYLFLLAGAIWAAWYFNVNQYVGDLGLLSDLIPQKTQPEADKTSARDRGVQDIPIEGTAKSVRSRPPSRPPEPVVDQSPIVDKYSSERDRYLRQRENSTTDDRQSSQNSTWRDPEFLAGARLYNSAIDKLDQYTASAHSGRPDSKLLDGVEDTIHRALEYFKSCRNRAPENVPIQKYIDNCYKLIARTRQSKLLDMGH